MIQQIDSVGGWFAFIIILFVVLLVLYLKSMVVVPFNEIHVVSKGKNVFEFDGKGRYAYLPFLYGRTIIPKHVLGLTICHMLCHFPSSFLWVRLRTTAGPLP